MTLRISFHQSAELELKEKSLALFNQAAEPYQKWFEEKEIE